VTRRIDLHILFGRFGFGGSVLGFAVLAGVLGLGGCGSSTSSAAPAQPALTVSGGGQVRLGSTAQLTATVTNEANTSVTWQVNGVAGGSSAVGTISATGLYTPPTVIPTQNTMTITAVSVAVPTLMETASETVLNPLPVVTAATVTQTFGATTGLLDVIGTGFVSGAQLQATGATVTTTFVSATELKATIPAVSGTTTLAVDVVNPSPGGTTSTVANAQVSTSQVTVSGGGQVRLGSTSQLTATVIGLANTSVTWQVNGVTGGSSAVGTISTTGLYTPPAVIPTQNTMTITAVSVVLPTLTGTASEAVLNPVPVVTTATVTQQFGATTGLLDVIGTGFVSGAQLQNAGAGVTTVFVSSTELQATVPVTTGTTTMAVGVVNPNPGTVTTAATAQVISLKASLTSAARLLDQATFGPTLTDIQHVETVGLQGYLTEQFGTASTIEPDIATPAPTICVNTTVPCQQSEWWQAAVTGPDQLRQRVAFALSSMFVISTNSVNARSVTPYQNILVNDAFANFYTIMHDVSLSPGMGAYLNMLNSAKPGMINGVAQIANENYSRELMQLFTTGIDMLNQDGSLQLDGSGNPIPVYTEAQVQAFAKAYTGWTYATATGGSPTTYPNNTANYDSPMAPVESQHDMTQKVLLNGTTLPATQTAEADLAGALTNIFNHQNVGPFVCRQLIQHLVASNPSPAYVARVSAVFANDGSGVRGNMKAVIQAILLDADARAGDTSPNFDGGHLREPMLYLANLIRGLSFTNKDAVAGNDVVANASYNTLSNYSSPLGEKPYTSGSVFNFFPPNYVIPGTTTNAPEFGQENTASAVLRLTLANTVVYNGISGFTVDLSATSPLGIMASATGNATTDSTNLVNALANIFLHGQMPAQMQTDIVNHVATLTNIPERVRVATYLVITSSQYKIEH
jgi:uncharacterized protein (DUF1800 family)